MNSLPGLLAKSPAALVTVRILVRPVLFLSNTLVEPATPTGATPGLTQETLDIYTHFRFRVSHAESGESRRCAEEVIVRSDVRLRRSIGRLGNV